MIERTDLHSKIPFRLDGPFVQRYFGKKKERLINYAEFSQLLHDIHEEYAMEAFKSKDPEGTGYISALDFQDIMVSVKRHLLTEDVKDNLVAVSIRAYACMLFIQFFDIILFFFVHRLPKVIKSVLPISWPLIPY